MVYKGGLHEHGTNDPVRKCRGYRSIQEEVRADVEATFGEQRYRAYVEHDTASEREDNQLNEDERSDLQGGNQQLRMTKEPRRSSP